MNNDNHNNIDNIFDEDINFTAITDGLGFHHSVKSENEVQKSLKSKSMDLKKDFDARIKQLSNQKTTTIDMGDLSPFYSKEDKRELTVKLQDTNIGAAEEVATPKNVTANVFERFGAWIIDFVMISVVFFVVFVSAILLTNTPLSFAREMILGKEFFITLMPLFAEFYLFYFSFFDKTLFSSPGKKIFGLRVVSFSDNNISMLQAFGRAIITLISFFTMGLLIFLDAQSRLTDTKVIRR